MPRHIHKSKSAGRIAACQESSASCPAAYPPTPFDLDYFEGKVARMQPQFHHGAPKSRRPPIQYGPSVATTIPKLLQLAVQRLSGICLQNARLYYNSPFPKHVNALAFARGCSIHIAPGQERLLPHEAWHLVQQSQGRVRSLAASRSGICTNDNGELEHEANVMGSRAMAIAPLFTASGVFALTQPVTHSDCPRSIPRFLDSAVYKTSALPKSSQAVSQLKPSSSSAAVNEPVQRTKWRFDGDDWNSESSSSSDTDTYLQPIVSIQDQAGDTYDQNTGRYQRQHQEGASDSEDSDPEWTPRGIMDEGFDRSRNPETQTSLERVAANMTGSIGFQTGLGPVTASFGRGRQPRVSSRLEDFGFARVGTRYSEVLAPINRLAPRQQEKLALAIFEVLEEGKPLPRFGFLTPSVKRAVAMLIGITQIAEQHHSRTPGSAPLARAAILSVADGVYTFEDAFNALPFVSTGGTAAMRALAQSHDPVSDEILGLIGGLMDRRAFGRDRERDRDPM